MAKKKNKKIFNPTEKLSGKGRSQEEVNKLIDAGVSVGSRRVYSFTNPGTKRKERQAGEGVRPAAKHVAEAFTGGHITASEANELNPYYRQHTGQTMVAKAPKERKPRAKKPKVDAQPATPDYEIRVVNGREFKVYKLAEDKQATAKARSEDVGSNYRAKEGRY